MRPKRKNENKHIIATTRASMRVETTSNSTNEVPKVLIYSIDFDFNGITTPEEYEKFNEQLYKYMYRKYPQDKKIININLPDVEGYKSNIKYFNKKIHHCKVEVYLRNEQETPFDEWESELVTDEIRDICNDIEDIFWKFGFLVRLPVRKGKKVDEIFG